MNACLFCLRLADWRKQVGHWSLSTLQGMQPPARVLWGSGLPDVWPWLVTSPVPLEAASLAVANVVGWGLPASAALLSASASPPGTALSRSPSGRGSRLASTGRLAHLLDRPIPALATYNREYQLVPLVLSDASKPLSLPPRS